MGQSASTAPQPLPHKAARQVVLPVEPPLDRISTVDSLAVRPPQFTLKRDVNVDQMVIEDGVGVQALRAAIPPVQTSTRGFDDPPPLFDDYDDA